MRKTALVTVSFPHSILSEAKKVAQKEGMTRSELLRLALRRYLEELRAEEAIRIAEKERRAGKLKVLRGRMSNLMK
ncbi:MAG: hypothetical protein A2826_01150 [Candidatus Doudnabacteria bacterium RIFCSPHIGHO2_01_FULL_43_23]|uniref:Ribbon-helix-helix protein CopG domain-containing protein n=1 Tax=Candidatus Doudnabacteria bacterium RIFCSPHIGHO2_01_FULL_43_23 TaxID=1817822 RepID=A0A1F5NSV8_9BACT|nr:MAG: hypothetical protein A2826_01150 [Candidatus Doudnabacteria bacterium RIFCSPHIGHO2_01_FULL_43_23]